MATMDESISQLCNNLNLDKETADEVWKTFTKVNQQFIVEGDKTQWAGCAIYVITNNKNSPNANNGVYLAQILRLCKLRLVDFLSMMDKWLKMTEQGNEMRSKIAHLERNFNVSAVVFKKYKEIFPYVFKSISATSKSSANIASTTNTPSSPTKSPASTTNTTSSQQQAPSSSTPSSTDKQQASSNKTPTPTRTRKSAAAAAAAAAAEAAAATNNNNKVATNNELCTADIYYFCWVLYINIKATRPAISEDLVNSYHLLLACIDFCYSNALVSKHAHDVLNPNFKGLPENFQSEEFKLLNPLKQQMCILQVLCNDWDGIVVDAKGIREHWLKPYIKELVNRKVLKAFSTNEPPNTYLGVFDSCNFAHNMNKIVQEHDSTMRSMGDFDERIFLTENAHKELGAPAYDLGDLKRMINERDSSANISPTSANNNEDNDKSVKVESSDAISIVGSATDDTTSNSNNINTTITTNTTSTTPTSATDLDKQKPSLENGGRFVPHTPLSNRNYLATRPTHPSSPVANATSKVVDLYKMLAECTGEPSASLEDIFKLCTTNPRESIMTRVSQMVDKFVVAYTSPDQGETQAIELARRRVNLARKLYFKVLESIIIREQKRLPTDKIGDSLSGLLSHEIFHISLFACCVEIVLASHNAKRTFPWVLDVYKEFGETRLYPFLFYKVIELVIREEERLSRDIVKHLATIEEKVLDSMAWESDSPLWTTIAANGIIPSCQDVVLPPTNNGQNPFEMSPLTALRRYEGFQSPMPVSGRYSVTPLEGGARRRLFDGGLSNDVSSTTTISNSGTAGSNQPQILQVVMPHKSEHGDIKYVILNASALDSEHSVVGATQRHQDIEHSPAPIRPTLKANPVNLFFRKVYYLAQLRFRDLWTRLEINSIDQRRIWTLFEEQIRNHTNLLRDRHLDHMIMCATYAVIKVCKTERSGNFFLQIMKAYRYQPQANIEVYRNVLLSRPPLRLLDDGHPSSVGSRYESSSLSNSSNSTKSPSKRNSVVNSPTKNGNLSGSGGNGGASSSSATAAPSNVPERGDVINFYNRIYMHQLRSVIVRLATQPDSSLSLSPLPCMNTNPISPWRRVCQKHSVYVSPLKCNSKPTSHGDLSYNFHRSPGKDLQAINSMINKQRAACKRILQDDDGENTRDKRHCISDVASKRINDIMNDRRSSK